MIRFIIEGPAVEIVTTRIVLMNDVWHPFLSYRLLDSHTGAHVWVALAGSSSRDIASLPVALM